MGCGDGPARRERAAWSSSCSRNAHDKNVLVRRAQSRIDQATLEDEIVEGITRAEEGWRLMIFCACTTRGLRRR